MNHLDLLALVVTMVSALATTLVLVREAFEA